MKTKHLLPLLLLSFANSFCDSPQLKGLRLRAQADRVERTEFTTSGVDVQEIGAPNEKKLKELLERYIDEPITEEMLQAVRQDILSHYEVSGRPLVIVSLPEQEVSTGALQLLVRESKLGEIRVRGNRHFSSKSISDNIQLVPGEPIDQDTLVQNISYVNRHPYRRAQFVYTPGQEPDSTDIELLVEERDPFRVYAGVESTGRKQLSRERYFAGLQWGKAFGMHNQTLSYQYATAENFSFFQSHYINYTLFMPREQILQLFGGYTTIKSMLVDNVAQSRGFSVQASMRHDIPLPPNNDYTHELTWGFDFKRMNNVTEFLILTDPRRRNVNLTQLALSYAGRVDGDYLDMSAEINAFYSPGKWLGDQSRADYSAIRPNTKPNYSYLTAKWALAYTLPMNFTVSGFAQTQVSFNNLMPSEQFALGGHNTVRGYDEGYFNCDEAFNASFEFKTPAMRLLRTQNPKFRDSFQAVAFLDYGVGGNHEQSAGLPKRQWLLSAGPGIRYHIGSNFSFRFDWGFRLHDGSVGRSLPSFSTIIIY